MGILFGIIPKAIFYLLKGDYNSFVDWGDISSFSVRPVGASAQQLFRAKG